MEHEEFLKVYRHSMSHILAKAVIELFGKENVQYAIGPQIACTRSSSAESRGQEKK